MVGTICRDKRELPKVCKTKNDTIARFSSLLYRSNEIILTIYKGKPKKKVSILSSKHKTINKIGKNEKGLPEIVEFYNKTKFGVNIAD